MNVDNAQMLEQKIDYAFKDRGILKQALTHSSTASGQNYERLEFLGDRVLGLSIAQILYETFPQEKEGDMAKRLSALVQGSFLALRARDIALGEHIQFSEAEAQAGGAQNDHILADVFESLIGAMYLDSDFSQCYRFIEKLWRQHLFDMKAPPQHPKTGLQEWVQGQGIALPVYEVIDQSGPDHAPVFIVQLSVAGYPLMKAEGKTRQAAEKKVASMFLKTVQNEG